MNVGIIEEDDGIQRDETVVRSVKRDEAGFLCPAQSMSIINNPEPRGYRSDRDFLHRHILPPRIIAQRIYYQGSSPVTINPQFLRIGNRDMYLCMRLLNS